MGVDYLRGITGVLAWGCALLSGVGYLNCIRIYMYLCLL